MDIYAQIVESIIKSQENIIGPVAVEQATRIPGLEVNWDQHDIKIQGNGVKVINDLVSAYKTLFGQISVEVSKDAAASLLSKLPAGQELPEALR